MKLKFIFFLCLLLPQILSSKDIKYKVSDIPAELKENAKAVIRKNNITFEIKAINKATMYVDYAITILNENGIDNAYFMEYYDKFRRISNISATIWDENGEKIRKIPNDEILDYTGISGFSIYEDYRRKAIDPKNRTLPYTFEYSFEVDYNGLLSYPIWSLYSDFNISTEETSFTVISNINQELRYYLKNLDLEPEISKADGKIFYKWDTTNIAAIKSEPFSPPSREYIPMIFTAPSDYEIDDFQGNLETWKNFGQWNLDLLNGRDELPDETKEKIRQLVLNANTEQEKIEILYKYMQDKTRYVSIQMGIGGWQPFEAETVDRLSYGDCKALTNYMKTLLNEVGIKSYYTLVKAGGYASPIIKEFPSNQFNHAILFIPLENDSIWLECTSQKIPCGFLGDFTDDRDVLVIDDDGGKIVHTPVYSHSDNRQIRRATVTMQDLNNATANIETSYIGIYYDDMFGLLSSDDADRKKQMYKQIKIPNYVIESFNHVEYKNRIPSVDESVTVNINNFCTKVGNRILLTLNLMNKVDHIPKRIKDRRSDILIRRARTEIDTIIYEIASQYKVESIPDPINIISEFGNYNAEAYTNGNDLIYIRKLTINKGRYPASEYEKFIDFMSAMRKADQTKVMITTRL